MSFVDLIAIALEWLNAYRARDLFIIDLYAADALLQCNCGGKTELSGTQAISAYWRQRLTEKVAGELISLRSYGSDIVVLLFRESDEIVKVTLTFNPDGSLRRSQCDPSSTFR